MMTVMPVAVRGPLAGVVMDRLAAWLAAEGYSQTMVPPNPGCGPGVERVDGGPAIAAGWPIWWRP